jgi:hypothetical protein
MNGLIYHVLGMQQGKVVYNLIPYVSISSVGQQSNHSYWRLMALTCFVLGARASRIIFTNGRDLQSLVSLYIYLEYSHCP